jgi:hypothetical protein
MSQGIAISTLQIKDLKEHAVSTVYVNDAVQNRHRYTVRKVGRQWIISNSAVIDGIHYLRNIEISQRTHKQRLLLQIRLKSLKTTRHNQH